MAFDISADPTFPNVVLKTLDDFRHSGICVDTKLIAQADEANVAKNYLWCHKCVISAASPFFRGLFSSDMREKAENSVTLHGISYRTLQHLVDFMYTGKARLSSDAECIRLLTAAGFLAIDELINACATCLGRKLTVNNCLETEKAAESANCPWLIFSAKEYTLANFEAVCNTASFLDLDYNRLLWYIQNYAESVMGVGSDHVLDGCDTVYRALGKWTSHQGSAILGRCSSTNSSSANNHVENFRTYCSSEPCSCTEICTCELNSNVSNLPTVQNLFAQLLSFSIIDANPAHSSEKGTSHQVLSKHRESSTQQIGVIIVACGRSSEVWAFSQKRNSWLALPSLPHPIRKAGLCALAGSLYVVGGTVNDTPTDEVWRLDVLPASWHLIQQPADSRPVARWIPVKPLPHPRAGHAVAAIGDRFICILGGYGNGSHLAEQILCYDRINDKWLETGRSASVPRIGARLAVIANYGGVRSRHSSSSSCTGENKVYSPQLPLSWTLLEVGGLQAGGRLPVIDCYSVNYATSLNLQNQSSSETLMPDEISISFSGEQLLLPQAVRFAEPVVLGSEAENSSRLLVVCSDFGSPTSTSSVGAVRDSGYCFILSFDLKRRVCRVVSPHLPNGTRIRPAVARSSDGSSIFVAGGRIFAEPSSPLMSDEPDHVGNNFKAVATVEMFDAESGEWKRVSDMPQPRSGHCSALLLFVNY